MTKIFWIIYLSLFSIFLPLVEITSARATAINKIYLAEASSDYNQYMQQGYAANSRRNYRKALGFFQQALNARPGDRYAKAAINNVNRHLQGKSRIGFYVGKPGRTVSAGIREGLGNQETPIILEPTSEEPQLTTAAYPKFFFYIPKSSANSLEFSLTDDSDPNKKILYKATFNPPQNQSGIVSISLPENSNPKLSPLDINKIYNWNLITIYNPENPDLNRSIQGKIQRIKPDENLSSLLKSAKSPQEQVLLYTTVGIWEDPLRILASLHRSQPRDWKVERDWQDLLKSPWEYLLQSPTLEPGEKQNAEASMKAVIKAPLVDVKITNEEINP